MALNGYTSIPANATLPGAPIDAFLLRTLRQNDDFFEARMRAMFASPFLPMGGAFPTGLNPNIVISGAITDTHRVFNYNVKTIELQSVLDTKAGVPLIWFATEQIWLKESIEASGKGAQKGEKGDFGGSGGARQDVPSAKCELPLVSPAIDLAGAAAVPSAPGKDAMEMWGSRLPYYLHAAKGGGAGARNLPTEAGGEGGGIVILCAPKIKIDAGKRILAKGNAGLVGGDTNGNGGGGGGVIILIAHEFENVNTGDGGNVNADGGAGNAPTGKIAGGNGGKGLIMKIEVK
ncbi:MAG: hypothetical protein RLZZ165_167 [Bacteroidota bacterium]|jgi:hypothetical protein